MWNKVPNKAGWEKEINKKHCDDDNIVYIDINFILKNSIVGKSINNQIKNLQSAENEKFKTIEKKLIENEKKIISQKKNS